MSCDHGYVNPDECPSCPLERESERGRTLERIADALERIADALELGGPS